MKRNRGVAILREYLDHDDAYGDSAMPATPTARAPKRSEPRQKNDQQRAASSLFPGNSQTDGALSTIKKEHKSPLDSDTDQVPETPKFKMDTTLQVGGPVSPFSPLFNRKRQRVNWKDEAMEDLSLSICRKVSVVVMLSEKSNKICLFPPTPDPRPTEISRELIVVNPKAFGNSIPPNLTMDTARLAAEIADTADWARSYKFHQVVWPKQKASAMENLTQALANDISAPGSIAQRLVVGYGKTVRGLGPHTKTMYGNVAKQSVARAFASEESKYGDEVLERYGMLGLLASIILPNLGTRVFSVSILEVVGQDYLYDMLVLRPYSTKNPIKVKLQHHEACAVVTGLSETQVGSAKQLGHLVRRAFSAALHPARKTPRGHLLTTVTIHDSSDPSRRTACRFLDLACTDAPENRQSVLALGAVLRSILLREAGNESPVTFRGNLLTKVLQKNMIQADSRVVVLAAATTASAEYGTTIHTLRFMNHLLARPGDPVRSPFNGAKKNHFHHGSTEENFTGQESRLLQEVLSDPRQRLAKVIKSAKKGRRLPQVMNSYTPRQYENPDEDASQHSNLATENASPKNGDDFVDIPRESYASNTMHISAVQRQHQNERTSEDQFVRSDGIEDSSNQDALGGIETTRIIMHKIADSVEASGSVEGEYKHESSPKMRRDHSIGNHDGQRPIHTEDDSTFPSWFHDKVATEMDGNEDSSRQPASWSDPRPLSPQHENYGQASVNHLSDVNRRHGEQPHGHYGQELIANQEHEPWVVQPTNETNDCGQDSPQRFGTYQQDATGYQDPPVFVDHQEHGSNSIHPDLGRHHYEEEALKYSDVEHRLLEDGKGAAGRLIDYEEESVEQHDARLDEPMKGPEDVGRESFDYQHLQSRYLNSTPRQEVHGKGPPYQKQNFRRESFDNQESDRREYLSYWDRYYVQKPFDHEELEPRSFDQSAYPHEKTLQKVAGRRRDPEPRVAYPGYRMEDNMRETGQQHYTQNSMENTNLESRVVDCSQQTEDNGQESCGNEHDPAIVETAWRAKDHDEQLSRDNHEIQRRIAYPFHQSGDNPVTFDQHSLKQKINNRRELDSDSSYNHEHGPVFRQKDNRSLETVDQSQEFVHPRLQEPCINNHEQEPSDYQVQVQRLVDQSRLGHNHGEEFAHNPELHANLVNSSLQQNSNEQAHDHDRSRLKDTFREEPCRDEELDIRIAKSLRQQHNCGGESSKYQQFDSESSADSADECEKSNYRYDLMEGGLMEGLENLNDVLNVDPNTEMDQIAELSCAHSESNGVPRDESKTDITGDLVGRINEEPHSLVEIKAPNLDKEILSLVAGVDRLDKQLLELGRNGSFQDEVSIISDKILICHQETNETQLNYDGGAIPKSSIASADSKSKIEPEIMSVSASGIDRERDIEEKALPVEDYSTNLIEEKKGQQLQVSFPTNRQRRLSKSKQIMTSDRQTSTQLSDQSFGTLLSHTNCQELGSSPSASGFHGSTLEERQCGGDSLNGSSRTTDSKEEEEHEIVSNLSSLADGNNETTTLELLLRCQSDEEFDDNVDDRRSLDSLLQESNSADENLGQANSNPRNQSNPKLETRSDQVLLHTDEAIFVGTKTPIARNTSDDFFPYKVRGEAKYDLPPDSPSVSSEDCSQDASPKLGNNERTTQEKGKQIVGEEDSSQFPPCRAQKEGNAISSGSVQQNEKETSVLSGHDSFTTDIRVSKTATAEEIIEAKLDTQPTSKPVSPKHRRSFEDSGRHGDDLLEPKNTSEFDKLKLDTNEHEETSDTPRKNLNNGRPRKYLTSSSGSIESSAPIATSHEPDQTRPDVETETIDQPFCANESLLQSIGTTSHHEIALPETFGMAEVDFDLPIQKEEIKLTSANRPERIYGAVLTPDVIHDDSDTSNGPLSTRIPPGRSELSILDDQAAQRTKSPDRQDSLDNPLTMMTTACNSHGDDNRNFGRSKESPGRTGKQPKPPADACLYEIDELEAAVDEVRRTNSSVWQASLASIENLRKFQASQKGAMMLLANERDEAQERCRTLERKLQQSEESHRQRLRSKEAEVGHLQTEVSEVKAVRQEVVRIAEEAISTQAELEAKVVELQSWIQNSVSINVHESVVRERDSFRLQVERAHEKESKTSDIIEEQKEVIAEIKEKWSQKDLECRKLENDLLSERHSNSLQRQQIQSLNDKHEEKEESFRNQIVELDKELEVANDHISNLAAENKRILKVHEATEQEQVDELNAKDSQLRIAKEKAASNNALWEKDRHQLQSEIMALRNQMNASQSLTSELEKEHKKVKDERETVQQILSKTETELENRVKDISELSRAVEVLLVQKEKDRKKVAEMEASLTSFRENTRSRVETVVRHRKEAAVLLEKTLAENKSLQATNEELTKKVEALVHEFASEQPRRFDVEYEQNHLPSILGDIDDDSGRVGRRAIGEVARTRQDHASTTAPASNDAADIMDLTAHLALSAKNQTRHTSGSTKQIYSTIYTLDEAKDDELSALKRRIKALERKTTII